MSEPSETSQPSEPSGMGSSSALLARLRGEPEALDSLVGIGLEYVLERPLAELIDASWLARAVTDGVRASARSPEFERWVSRRVEQALTRVDGLDGALAERVPVTLLGPLQTALGRPYQPDRELVRALFDHPSTRAILREVLQANILEFGKRMRSMVPDTGKIPGSGFASRLAGVAKGVASAVSSELERQLEPRVESFVEDILGVAVNMMVEQVSSEAFAPEFAKWRVDVLHAFLNQPLDRLVAERHKYPAGDFAADVAAILRALAAWRGLGEQVEALLQEQLREAGDTSARAFLDGSGLEDAWRPQLHQALVDQGRAFMATDAFAAWLEVLCDSEAEQD